MKTDHIFRPFVLTLLLAFAVLAPVGLRANSPQLAWGDVLGWVSFSPDFGGIVVTDTRVRGYIWSSTYGWLNLSPGRGGVTNTPDGLLGGYAWSPMLGWIPFTGVRITEDGVFTGVAGSVGSLAGRLSFDCTRCHVVTEWRPISVRDAGNDGHRDSARDKSLMWAVVKPLAARALPPLASVYGALTESPSAAVVTHRVRTPASGSMREAESREKVGADTEHKADEDGSVERPDYLPLPVGWKSALLSSLALLLVVLAGLHFRERRRLTNITH